MIYLVWGIYFISALLDLFENYWIVHRWPIERPALYTPQNQSVLYISRILLFICSIIGIWYFHYFYVALIAFLAHLILGFLSSKYFYNKKLASLYRYYYDIYKETSNGDAETTEKEIIALSEEKAKERIIKNMKGIN